MQSLSVMMQKTIYIALKGLNPILWYYSLENSIKIIQVEYQRGTLFKSVIKECYFKLNLTLEKISLHYIDFIIYLYLI